MQDAWDGDSETLPERLTMATQQVEAVQPDKIRAICGHRKSGSSGVPRRELSLLPVPDGAHAVVAGPGQLVRRAGSARSASATSGAFGWVRRKPNCPVYETGRVKPGRCCETD